MNVIDEFNSKNRFQINTPPAKYLPMLLNEYEDEIKGKIRDLERYEGIRFRGYSEDHLASEIGSFVLELNKIISQMNRTEIYKSTYSVAPQDDCYRLSRPSIGHGTRD